MSGRQQLLFVADQAPVPNVEFFGSGASAAWDFLGYRTARQPVGVTATELRPRAISLIANYLNGTDCVGSSTGRVFCDSGSFGQFQAWRAGEGARERLARGAARDGDEKAARVLTAELDFEGRVFPVYEALIDAINPGRHSGLLLVAPDVIGNPQRSIELQRKHVDRLRRWISLGAEVMFPIQDGVLESAVSTYQAIDAMVGSDRFVVGVPSNKCPWSRDQIMQFARYVRPRRIHLLGLGDQATLGARAGDLRAVSPETTLSADSCKILAAVGEGRRLTVTSREWDQSIVEWCATTTGDENPLVDLSAFTSAVMEEPGFVSPIQAGRLAAAIGLDTEWQERFAASAADGLSEVIAQADPDEEWIHAPLCMAIKAQLYGPWAKDRLAGVGRAWALMAVAAENPFACAGEQSISAAPVSSEGRPC
jgi:hypothetical protein